MSELSRTRPGRGRTRPGRGQGGASWRAASVALLVTLASSAMLASSGSASTFTNGARLDVPANGAVPRSGPASIYPSPITVSGLPGGVVKATATVRGLYHPLGQELDALLVAPNGAKSILFSEVCLSPDVTGTHFAGDFTFDDTAPPVGCTSGTYRPTDGFPGSEDFPTPAPADPHTAAMANFVGAPANGTWQLFVRDQVGDCGFPPFCPPGGVGGVIARGWTLELLPEANCAGRPAVLAAHVGTAADDELVGTPGDDVIIGLGGDDDIEGRGGADIICGGAGNDNISGNEGKDSLRGGKGKDRLRGGKGKDSLRGGKGKDRLSGNKGRDKLLGGRGKDRLRGGKGKDRCKGGKGRDKLSSC